MWKCYTVCLVLVLPFVHCGVVAEYHTFPAIFVFGDSLSDTGNAALDGRPFVTLPPYGVTFPGTSIHRFCDGRLLIDFLATALGLPFPNPSLDSARDFSFGVDYAVAGATSLHYSFLATNYSILTENHYSLEVQVSSHLDFRAAVLASADEQPGRPSPRAFGNGLYVFYMGGLEYILAAAKDYTPAYINTTFVPLVIQKIRDATEALLTSGEARNFLYISMKPLGCAPSVLASYDSAAKDSAGCLKEYNSIAYNHGVQLLNEVKRLRSTYPDASFFFADAYDAYTFVLQEKASFGLINAFDACCGAGPVFPHNVNSAMPCNISSWFVCRNPTEYFNWDGVHGTDKLNSAMADLFKSGAYLDPPDMIFNSQLVMHPSMTSDK